VSNPAGYSGTPLPRKLGLKDGQIVAFVAVPPELAHLRAAVDFGQLIEAPTAADLAASGPVFDLVWAFFTTEADLHEALGFLRAAIKPDGAIWISWPKRASKVPTDVTEDVIRAAALPTLVDVKVCAVDDVWSGLKLVIPVAQRGR
jgi:hypothetical protein